MDPEQQADGAPIIPLHRQDYLGRGTVQATSDGQWLARFYPPLDSRKSNPPKTQIFNSVIDAENYLAGLSYIYDLDT